MKFLIKRQATYTENFEVEAETEEEAKELVLEGEVDDVESEFLEADLDSNNWDVSRLFPAAALPTAPQSPRG